MSQELLNLVEQTRKKEVYKGSSSEEKEWLEFQRELMEQKREIALAIEKTNAVCLAGETALSDAYLKLETFATNKLPLLIKSSVEETANIKIKKAIEEMFSPLKVDVEGITHDVEICRKNLRSMSWNWRLYVSQIGTGIVSALITGGLIYYGVLYDFRRYAVWGKKAVAKIESYSPKTREILFQDFGGRP